MALGERWAAKSETGTQKYRSEHRSEKRWIASERDTGSLVHIWSTCHRSSAFAFLGDVIGVLPGILGASPSPSRPKVTGDRHDYMRVLPIAGTPLLLVELLGGCPRPTTRQASGRDRHLNFYGNRDNLGNLEAEALLC